MLTSVLREGSLTSTTGKSRWDSLLKSYSSTTRVRRFCTANRRLVITRRVEKKKGAKKKTGRQNERKELNVAVVAWVESCCESVGDDDATDGRPLIKRAEKVSTSEMMTRGEKS